MAQVVNHIKWENADFEWNDNPYLWNDVAFIEGINRAAGKIGLQNALDVLNPEKKKRLVHLIMRKKGIKIYDKSKSVKDVKINIKDVEMIIKEVKAQIEAENIHV